MTRILVTGAEGMVGSAVVARLRAAGHELTTLTLPDATPHDGVRVVRGDARDPDAVADAVRDVDAVAHLAAIPNPWHDPAQTVFANNVTATFTVLWTAAECGVRRFAIASSVNATGLIINPHRRVPPRYPIDESVEPDLADPYSLSKQVDEHTLRTVCRRFDASGVALRLPLMISLDNGPGMRRWYEANLDNGVCEGWSWLDVRDGAEAFRLALTADYDGAHVVQVASPETFVSVPTAELIERFAPGVPVTGSFPGRTAPVDTSRATDLLGFVARHSGAE
ncbi:NAD-dependent epimerase/dehydratase family protein [Virgisporangium aurantiacum]|uniref:UDP-glucose 4-epimerase n=1 Tax=Virgisporangium aurantiacum TaxID=175570 RepID=A0A8J4DZM6_9ACTN|nr:NAD(P)-dependent oxidoreductase [Virgisporangium aurantiacum]GIJ54192.1 UDP-glucose 4-epimerase [Virgisporangium aurantiacum]